MVDEEGQASDRDHQELHPEGIMVSVVGGLELGVDQVDGGVRTSNVDELEWKRLRSVTTGNMGSPQPTIHPDTGATMTELHQYSCM